MDLGCLLQDGEFRLWQDTTRRSLGRRGENAKVSLNFVPGPEGVQQSDDGVLSD